MKALTDGDVIRVMREEWSRRKSALSEELDMYAKAGNDIKEPVLSPGLKLKDKKTGTLCTIDATGKDSVILKKPEGGLVMVPGEDLEKEFDLA